MKSNKSIILIITISFFTLEILYLLHNRGDKVILEIEKQIQSERELLGISEHFSSPDLPTHRDFPFESSDFFKAVSEAKNIDRDINYHVYGGVIPHHLLPSFIISDFFRSLSKQKVTKVLLIGPNHFERGKSKIITSRYNWDTPFGSLEPNLTIIDMLVSTQISEIDEDVVLKDHSIYGILPFIKYYLPESKIVPILMSGYTSRDEVENFVENLYKYYDENTVIIASVDFSHYLNSNQAYKKDEETIKFIRDFDYESLFKLNSDNVDSPPSVASVMMMMENIGKKNMDIIHHMNSSDITGNVYSETTSYFSFFYY